MIRREIQLPGQPPQWLLISQVEHARLCGALAEHCLPELSGKFGAEFYQAVIHHDDGWATWDSTPLIDQEKHRPYSFRELPVAKSLQIWSESIEAAARSGPFVAWLVAQHFLALAANGGSASEQSSVRWKQQTTRTCDQWLQSWFAENPQHHTQELANSALRWLQLLDFMSLWLCSACPGLNESANETPESYLFDERQPLATWSHFRHGCVVFEPWRFDQPELELEAHGCVVPMREHTNSQELLAASSPHTIRWRISEE